MTWARDCSCEPVVEPLECPRCGQTTRIVAFITEPTVIDRILDHLCRAQRRGAVRAQRLDPVGSRHSRFRFCLVLRAGIAVTYSPQTAEGAEIKRVAQDGLPVPRQ